MFQNTSSEAIPPLDIAAPRLYRFAAILTGSRRMAHALLEELTAKHVPLNDPSNRSQALAIFKQLNMSWVQKLAAHSSAEGGEPHPQSSQSGTHQPDSPFSYDITAFQKNPILQTTWQFLAGLPPQQRAALLLVYGENFSHAEAAEILGTPVDFVVGALTLARTALIAADQQRVSQTDRSDLYASSLGGSNTTDQQTRQANA